MNIPPTKFDLAKGIFFLATAIIGTILLLALMSAGMCGFQALKTGELGRCTDLRIGEYLSSALLAVLALFGMQRKSDGS